MEKKIGKYDDIINLPHHTSRKRPRMSALNRAAQFAPFAALTGYDAAIKEKARVTEEFIELTDEEKEIINNKILMAIAVPDSVVTITYFQPDRKKSGGKYVSISSNIKKIDETVCTVIISDGTALPVNNIVDIIL